VTPAEASEILIAHYRQRANEARSMAALVADPNSRAILLDVASLWDRLAELEKKRCLSPRQTDPLSYRHATGFRSPSRPTVHTGRP
jgi:hypothetical protein